METLELRFLGDLEVVRAGRVVPLPPSRKTRALLAFLALQPRKFRREFLCELLWEVPDDPRGSLRWSLSKLRRLVDDPDCQRIVADRSHVSFDPNEVDIDVVRLRDIVSNGLAGAPFEDLENAASRFQGYFLEGLELSNFHDFHAWCIAERELNTQAQKDLLTEIVRRKTDEPEAALPFARSLVTIAPYSENARETLIHLLVSLGRTGEARQQYELGVRMLKEAGAEPTGVLTRALKAKPDANPETAVAPQTPERPTLPAHPTPERQPGEIVGREAELLQIAGTIEAAIENREAKLLLIRGEPGIGKSRLLRAAADMAEQAGAWVLESSAFESESIRPFAIWIDGLRRIAPETADRIFSTREGENREKLLGGLSDLVTDRAKQQPVALLFDDLQWCDDSSATALHYIARTNRQQCVVGILAARAGDIKDNAALQQALNGLRHVGLLTEIPLPPLSESEVRELIEKSAPDADSQQLSQQCGGNPLIALELARAGTAGASGDSLNELVRERLGRFDVASGEILRWAAVLAPRISIDLLEQLTESTSAEISNALELAERHGMLQPADRGFRFAHDLVARSIYTDISPARRRMMHRRIAEFLEQQTALDLEHAADLAHHAAQSGDAGLAARAMVSAARLCLRFYSNDEALTLAKRGLALVDKLPAGERVCLTIDFKDVMLLASPLEDWESAVKEFVDLAEQALDHGAMSHARRGYYMASYLRWMHGHWSGARDEVLQSERVSRGGTDEDHIVGMAEAARCLALLERDLTHADAMLMEAQALAARERIAHHSIPAALGMLRYHEGQFELAQELFQQARMLAKSAGDRISEYQSNEYLVMIEFERGDYLTARDRCKELIDIGTKLRFGSEEPFARALAAVCTYVLDRESGDLESAFEALREADAKHRLAYVLTRAAMIDLEQGQYDKAIERANESLKNANALDRATDILLAHVVLARAHREIDDEAAFKHHADSIAAFGPGRVAEWARIRAEEALA
jgi:DNA-binding SARP family transcriptional activator